MSDASTTELGVQTPPSGEKKEQSPDFIGQVVAVLASQREAAPAKIDQSISLLEGYQSALEGDVRKYAQDVREGRIKNPDIQRVLAGMVREGSLKTEKELLIEYRDGRRVKPVLGENDYDLKLQLIEALGMLPEGVTRANFNEYLGKCEQLRDIPPGKPLGRIRQRAEKAGKPVLIYSKRDGYRRPLIVGFKSRTIPHTSVPGLYHEQGMPIHFDFAGLVKMAKSMESDILR